jgi:hypothetical protein
VVRPLLLELHVHLRPARFVRVSASTCLLEKIKPGCRTYFAEISSMGRANSALPIPGTKNSFDETHGPGHPFLCSHLLGHDPRSLVHPVIVCGKTNRSC